MVQETGETRDAIIEEDEKLIQHILDANSNRQEKYWIVIFAKPHKGSVDGKPTLIKVIKPYSAKPGPQVGMLVGEVDNSKGTVEWEVNMPQRPFDFNALLTIGAQECNEVVTETTTIPSAYLTK